MSDKFIVGVPSQDPIKDCFELGGDIARRICVSTNPLEELRYIIKLCDTLWDMHVVTEENEVKKVVLKTDGIFL